jgi:hypothetical protein
MAGEGALLLDVTGGKIIELLSEMGAQSDQAG